MFSAELVRVLSEGPRNPVLRLRFNAFNEGVHDDDVMDAVIREWAADGPPPGGAEHGTPGVLLPMAAATVAFIDRFDPLFPIAGTLIPVWAVSAGARWALRTK